MSSYFGVVIEQSLADSSALHGLEVVARKRDPNGAWVFLLVRIPQDTARTDFARVQSALEKGKPWYAHFVRGTEMAVIFSDAVFFVSTDPTTWADVRSHGLRLGIPEHQLDFCPRTPGGFRERFGIDVPS